MSQHRRNKWKQSKLIRNGTSIKEKAGQTRGRRVQAGGDPAASCDYSSVFVRRTQDVWLWVSFLGADVYLVEKTMKNDFHGKYCKWTMFCWHFKRLTSCLSCSSRKQWSWQFEQVTTLLHVHGKLHKCSQSMMLFHRDSVDRRTQMLVFRGNIVVLTLCIYFFQDWSWDTFKNLHQVAFLMIDVQSKWQHSILPEESWELINSSKVIGEI